MLDNDLNIDKSKLVGYNTPKWYNDDGVLQILNGEYTIVSYNIDEYRMGSYACNLGVFSNSTGELILSTDEIWVNYKFDDTFNILENFNCLAFTILAAVKDSKKSAFPLIILDLKKRSFCIIEDYCYRHCVVEKFTQGQKRVIIFKVQQFTSDEIECDISNKDVVINLDEQEWYGFSKFKNAIDLYIKQ